MLYHHLPPSSLDLPTPSCYTSELNWQLLPDSADARQHSIETRLIIQLFLDTSRRNHVLGHLTKLQAAIARKTCVS